MVLVGLQRDALRDGIESSAEDRASALADQIEADGLPDSLVWTTTRMTTTSSSQVTDESGRVVLGAQDLPDEGYLTVSEDADSGGEEYDVRVAASLEDVDESHGCSGAVAPGRRTRAPAGRRRDHLGGGDPGAGSGREDPAGGREIERGGLRRVPVPRARDEIQRLATTMNGCWAARRVEATAARFVVGLFPRAALTAGESAPEAEVARTHPGALPEGELADAVFEETVRMQRLVDQMLLLTRTDEGAVG